MQKYEKECKAIVLEYLYHYCYKDTTKAFLKESIGLEESLLDSVQKDWSKMNIRKDIYQCITKGDIGKAFKFIEAHFPNYSNLENKPQPPENFEKAHRTLYKLRCQQFIEIARTLDDLQAIEFAKYYLGPCSKIYSEMIQDVTALIVYPCLPKEQTEILLSQERRDLIADEVNMILLESLQLASHTSLEKLSKQMMVTKELFDKQIRHDLLIPERYDDNELPI